MPSEAARAKVNLFLHVLGRRPDGYHLLDSLAVFAEVGDTVRAAPGEQLSLSVTGPFAPSLAGLDPAENLVLRAAQALRRAASVREGAQLELEKTLPVASGIGGGSADAAAALIALRALWRLDLAPAELAALGLELGADVPVCLVGTAGRMGGVGEVIGTAPALPPCGLVLVNPGMAVATAEVFRARRGGYSAPAALPPGWASAAAMAADLAELRNDLEPAAMALCPTIAEVLAWLRGREGCLLARMSGSGATCFGLFASPAAAQAEAAEVPAGWWGWGGGVA